ncbi:MAG: hypothetical protein COT15_04395 [Candidatus Diapherotrites archaeon CG08_land_8_20_14_0_20_34_12]|nr:MAG: hypothetical protein COT15_04395 [Candidatus Diapherotrites archaeon CG08_land_8_20_14_0_20_34_12]
MKQTNLYQIKELALKSGRAVYSIQQLANLIKKPKSIAKVYSSRLVNKGLAKRILQGKISFIDDDFIIASQLIEPSYISLTSALLFHKLIQQMPANVECVTTKNSRRYKNAGIVYHKIPCSLFYGYEKYKNGPSYIFAADAEKALVDSVYLNSISKNSIGEMLSKLDKKKLEDYINRFKGRGKKKLVKALL